MKGSDFFVFLIWTPWMVLYLDLPHNTLVIVLNHLWSVCLHWFRLLSLLLQVSPQSQRLARASVSDVSSSRDIDSLSVRQLKEILARNFVNYSGCCEKWELVERVCRLSREREKNRKSRGYCHTLHTHVGEQTWPLALQSGRSYVMTNPNLVGQCASPLLGNGLTSRTV